MTDDPPDRLVGETVDERWKLLDKLGAGGMGVVYRAERVKLGKQVAIKFLDERAVSSKPAVARFDREARAISRLHHRHCVSILDFGVWRRQPYIVMEYVAGRPLNKEMGKPTMTAERAVPIMRQILEALRHAHAMGVVHRDLKPENVMLTEATGENDFVKLLDFGLARIISVDEPSISMPKMVAGTPSYMSPEQARGEKVDHRTDIYSAGILLYGMVTGKKPFSAPDTIDVLRMHMNMRPPPPRKAAPDKKISAELEKVILRALEKERDARFYHAEEFLAALDAVPEARAAAATGRWRNRALAAAALVLLAAGGGVGWRWHARRAAERASAATATEPAAGGTAPAAAATTTAATTTAAPTATTPPPATTTTTTTAATPAAATATTAETAAAPDRAAAAAGAAPTTTGAPAATGATEAPAPTPSTAIAASDNPTAGHAAAPGTPGAATAPPPAAATSAPGTTTASPPAAAPSTPDTATAPPPTAAPSTAAPSSPARAAAAAASPSPAVAADPAAAKVAAMLDADKLPDAVRLLTAQAILEPDAGWVHLQLGEVYFRRLWRRDAEREWDEALHLDRSLRRDPRLGQRLCQALGPTWSGAGQRLIVRYFGADAVAPLTACIRDATDVGRVQTAARLIERVAGRDKVDRALVAARTAELTRRR